VGPERPNVRVCIRDIVAQHVGALGHTSRPLGDAAPWQAGRCGPHHCRVNDDELDRLYAAALAWTAAPAPAIEAVRSVMRGRPGRIARLRALRAACQRQRPIASLAELPQPLATLATLDPHVRDAAVVTDVAGLPPESGAMVLGVPAETVAARAECARVAVAVAHARVPAFV
jgi:DNA-directed RNA polymerase specialized sigma24 family protein